MFQRLRGRIVEAAPSPGVAEVEVLVAHIADLVLKAAALAERAAAGASSLAQEQRLGRLLRTVAAGQDALRRLAGSEGPSGRPD